MGNKKYGEEKRGQGRGDKGKSVGNEGGEKVRANGREKHARQKRGECLGKFSIARLDRRLAEVVKKEAQGNEGFERYRASQRFAKPK
jgi:hypothetical protein